MPERLWVQWAGFDIEVQGKGGHGAMPHVSRDHVVTASKIVCELQTIVSRELDPLDPGVVSVCAMHGGQAYNVIPETVQLRGTIRSLRLDGLHFLKRRITEMATGIASANYCQAEVVFTPCELPPTNNDPASWETTKTLGRELFGADKVHELSPVLGGEDFAFYLQRVPGCFVGLGIRCPSGKRVLSWNAAGRRDGGAVRWRGRGWRAWRGRSRAASRAEPPRPRRRGAEAQ